MERCLLPSQDGPPITVQTLSSHPQTSRFCCREIRFLHRDHIWRWAVDWCPLKCREHRKPGSLLPCPNRQNSSALSAKWHMFKLVSQKMQPKSQSYHNVLDSHSSQVESGHKFPHQHPNLLLLKEERVQEVMRTRLWHLAIWEMHVLHHHC